MAGVVASGQDWLNAWVGWDVRWYVEIARDGYSYTPGAQSSVAFAPALPMLMHALAALVGRTDEAVYVGLGMLITNLALLVALAYLYALARLDLDEGTARRAPLYLLVFPSTLFLSAVYPHSLFLAGSAGALYYARRRRWWLAGVFGAFAALSRLQGALVVVPLAYEYLAAGGFSVGARRVSLGARGFSVGARRVSLGDVGRDVVWLSLAPVGLLAYVAYCAWRFGAPLAPFLAQGAWDRHVAPPWEAFGRYLSLPWGEHGSLSSPLDLAFTLLLIALVALCWRRLRPSLALFATVFMLVFVSSASLVSNIRFGLELFPIFIALAVSGRSRLFHYSFVALSGLLALRFMMLYASGAWVA